MSFRIFLRSLVLTGLLAATAALSPNNSAAQEGLTSITQLIKVSPQMQELTQASR